MLFFVKVIVSALLIALATEMIRYNRMLSAMLISLPLTSIISFIWIYLEQKDTQMLGKLSMDVLWLVILSLPFFLVFTYLLKLEYNFWVALLASCGVLVVLYSAIYMIKSNF